MDEVRQLQEQVKLLTDTLKLAIERQEQAFHLYSEQAAKLEKLTERLLILEEALRKSLSESDNQMDDLAKVTALLAKLVQELQFDEQES